MAHVNMHDNSGNTALHFAASDGPLEVARMLLERNAEVDSQNSHGRTPLLLASELGSPDLVQLFLDHNADMHVCDAYGDTLLHRAAIAGQLEISRLLFKHDAKVTSRNNEGSTPLHLASAGYEAGHPDIVALAGARCRCAGPEPQRKDRIRRSPRSKTAGNCTTALTARCGMK
jgi:predicted LPLAT superfamily acyltransferase